MPNEPPRRTVIIDEPASDRDIIARSDFRTLDVTPNPEIAMLLKLNGLGRGPVPTIVIESSRARSAEDRFLERQLAGAVDVGLRKVDPLTLDEQAARRHYAARAKASEATIHMSSTASPNLNLPPMITTAKQGLVSLRRTKESKAARRMERRNRRLHRR